MLFAGILGGLAAVVFGVADWTAIPRGTRAKRVAKLHGVINAVALVIFILAWFLRMALPEQPPAASVILSALGEVLYRLPDGWAVNYRTE